MDDLAYWNTRWTELPVGSANNFAKRAYSLIKARNSKTLLDLGAGNGRDSIYFAKQGLHVTAVEFSESGIEALRSKGITVLKQDLQTINFKPNSFDVIYAHLSLQYFDDEMTSAIFANLHRTLKPGGLFFVKCKSSDDPLFGQGEKLGENMFFLGHVRHFFNKEYMQEKLKDFQILSVREAISTYHGHRSAFIEAVATR